MSFPLGIGIVTYNRKTILADTIDRVRTFTRQPDTMLVVADDGSTDGTLEMLREKNVPVVTGINMGIAWNKNRALFLLAQLLHCETVILLEDDTQPTRYGWEDEWMRAAQLWGHANFAGDWLSEHFLSGAGTAADPVISKIVTAQCSVYSQQALTFGGYFDSRFTGYGHEHVDHSRRLVRVGYGGTDKLIDGEEQVLFHSIKSDLTVIPNESFFNSEQEQKNLRLAWETTGEKHYRMPWREETQLRQFRSETGSTISQGFNRFCLNPVDGSSAARTKPGLFGRLFRRQG